MLYIYSQESIVVPDNVKIHIRSRIITVEGPRGTDTLRNYANSSATWRHFHELETVYAIWVGFNSATIDTLIGKLTKDLSHLAVSFSLQSKKEVSIEIHHGSRKNVATLRTVKSIINNLIVGVTKGFKYKMRYVYAHFPINVNIEKNKDTGLYSVEIR